MNRTCRYEPLSKQPLVLVLCQVKFSPVRKMADYIPAIQEEFRRNGFPIERAGKAQQITITPAGVQTVEQERWEYLNRDETRSILVLQDSVVLQSTSYDRFEGFANELQLALEIVLAKSEQDEFGIVQRLGLRYVDVVRQNPGQDYRFYLRSGLHGVSDQVFRPGSHRVRVESIGRTEVSGSVGTMVIRVVQNDQGVDLPPDLVASAPKRAAKAASGELITLIDMDHFIEGTFEPSAPWLVKRAYELHDHLIETFHEEVVTPEAIEEWR